MASAVACFLTRILAVLSVLSPAKIVHIYTGQQTIANNNGTTIITLNVSDGDLFILRVVDVYFIFRILSTLLNIVI